jgi:hypothetical protein
MNNQKEFVMNKAVQIMKWTILGLLFVLVFGGVVMLLWNWLIPSIFNLREITFWEALGLLLLGKLLFGGFHGKDRSRNGVRWKQHYYNKFSSMTPEERERFKAKMQEKWSCYRDKNTSVPPSDTSTV